MPDGKQLISVCVPVLNEEQNIEPLYQALLPIMDQVSARYDFELLFTDNHSTDGTFEIIQRLAATDDRVRGLRFSRNFGFQRSIFTAYMNAAGDAAVQIDCDLQDPPSLILDFIRKWEDGLCGVLGICCSRKGRWWMNPPRQMFYRIIDSLSED